MSLKEFVEQSMNVKNCDNQLSAGYEWEPGTRVRSSRVHKVIRLRYEERCLLLWCRYASAIDWSEALWQVINWRKKKIASFHSGLHILWFQIRQSLPVEVEHCVCQPCSGTWLQPAANILMFFVTPARSLERSSPWSSLSLHSFMTSTPWKLWQIQLCVAYIHRKHCPVSPMSSLAASRWTDRNTQRWSSFNDELFQLQRWRLAPETDINSEPNYSEHRFMVVLQSDPEFRPSMSEVVQSLLQCVQRTTSNRRLGGHRSVSQRSDDSDWWCFCFCFCVHLAAAQLLKLSQKP
jgi:hypothetical protein